MHTPDERIAAKVGGPLGQESLDVRPGLVRLEGGDVPIQLVEDPHGRRPFLGMREVRQRARFLGFDLSHRLGRQRVEGLLVAVEHLEPHDQAKATILSSAHAPTLQLATRLQWPQRALVVKLAVVMFVIL